MTQIDSIDPTIRRLKAGLRLWTDLRSVDTEDAAIREVSALEHGDLKAVVLYLLDRDFREGDPEVYRLWREGQ